MKLIDSTYHRGRAEREIEYIADFQQFQKRGFSKREILKVDIIEIQKKYNIKGFTFGNFVTQEERYFFLYKISKQLEFLAKLKGSNNLGFGQLVIGFGADGKRGSLAYFRPRQNYVNINRGRKSRYKGFLQGENSFVHEYAHFLDCQVAINDSTTNVNFASQSYDGKVDDIIVSKTKKKTVLKYADFIQPLKDDIPYQKTIRSKFNSSYLNESVEIYARLFEECISILAKGTKYAKFLKHSNYRGSDIYFGERRIKEHSLTDFIKPMLKTIR